MSPYITLHCCEIVALSDYLMHQGRCLAVQPDCLKGRIVCETVYGDMHLKNLLGSFVRVGYCIMVPDFYLVLDDLSCRKSTIRD